MEFCYRNLRNVYISPEIADVVEINAKHVILDDISLISAPVKELSFEQKIMKKVNGHYPFSNCAYYFQPGFAAMCSKHKIV